MPAPTTSDALFGSRRARRRLSSIEAAAIAGLVCAVGWLLSLRGLLSSPAIGATDAEIEDFYADRGNSTAIVAWLQLLVVGTVAFLWFVGVIRGRIGDREPRLFGTVFLGSSILLAGLLFLGASLVAAPAALVLVGDEAPHPDAVQVTRAAAALILSVFAPRMATLVMFATASLGRATGALPRWLIWTTYAAGVIEFVNVTISTPGIYLVSGWIGLVSVVLLVHRPAPLPPQGQAT